MPTETVELAGHIVDSLLLAKVLDLILESGSDYRIDEFEMGKTRLDQSHTMIEITAPDDPTMDSLLEQLQIHGANRVGEGDAGLVVCDIDGVLPEGFYSTTNLATDVRVDGRWRSVDNPEMDCGIVVTDAHVRTVAMHRVHAGDRIVVGFDGVRVHAPSRSRDMRNFEFMNSEVSSEKPKALLIDQVAQRIRTVKERGGKVLAVCGPAVVHTGG